MLKGQSTTELQCTGPSKQLPWLSAITLTNAIVRNVEGRVLT